MEALEVPEVIVAAPEVAAAAPRPAAVPSLHRGAVCVAAGGGEVSTVVVSTVLPTHCVVVAAHPYPEWCCAPDVVLDGVVAWPLVVESDLVVCVDAAQLSAPLGALDAAAWAAVRSTAAGRWPPLGRSDPRWAWKEQRGALLRAIAANRTRRPVEHG